jgi:hypothetical protein
LRDPVSPLGETPKVSKWAERAWTGETIIVFVSAVRLRRRRNDRIRKSNGSGLSVFAVFQSGYPTLTRRSGLSPDKTACPLTRTLDRRI